MFQVWHGDAAFRQHGAGSQPLLQLVVKFSQHLDPVQAALLDFVQVVFHFGGKADIEELRHALHEEIAYLHTQPAGSQQAFFLVDIVPVQYGMYGCRISAGSPHPILFQGLHQTGLAVAIGRAGETLLFEQFEQLAGLPFLESRQDAAGLVKLVLLAQVLHAIDCQVAGKQSLPGGSAKGANRAGRHRRIGLGGRVWLPN